MTEIITTELRVEDVHPHPSHYRGVTDANVKVLAKSIEAAGQLEPIIVVEAATGYYNVYAGHHRLAAMKLLGRETIAARVFSDWSEAASYMGMVASNLHVVETDIERSRGTQLLLNVGVKPIDVAAVTGEKQDRVSKFARGMKAIGDPVAAEDMTFDRMVAIAEFEGDKEAVAKLLNCTEDMWPRVARTLTDDRKRTENLKKAKAIVEASGCKLIEVPMGQSPAGLRYITQGDEMPEGATHATVRTSSYYTDATISWYCEATTAEAEDPAENARREQEALIKVELGKAAVRRVEFLAEQLKEVFKARSALLDFAEVAWADGWAADAGELKDTPLAELAGFPNRVYGAILADVDGAAARLMREMNRSYNSDYYLSENGADTVAYFVALEECGFMPTDAEAGLLVEIAEALAKADGGDDDE